MKKSSLASLVSCIVFSAAAFAEPKDLAQLQIYPKNLARQHLGANLFHYTPANQTYAPTEAAAAWLDDDITTGFPMLPGQQYYLLSLPAPELLTNFALSTKPADGTITLYAGTEPAPPGAKTWTVLAKNVPLDSVNEKKLAHAFSREAKYVLIETNVADPGPVYSLYLYGEKPAVDFNIQKRDQAINTKDIFGPFVNEQTSFNVAGLYAQSYIASADGNGGLVTWQKAIDDNPETSLTVPPSAEKGGVTIQYGAPQTVSRLAVLTDAGAKGKLEFFLVKRDADTAPPAITGGAVASPAAASTPPPGAEPAPVAAAPAPAAPTISMVLDGTNARSSVEFPATEASQMLVRWTPANGSDSVNIRELNAFGDPKLSTYATTMRPDAVAANGAADSSKDSSKDGKTIADAKGVKPPGIAEGPQSGPFLPGSLGFPPNVLIRNPQPPPVSQ